MENMWSIVLKGVIGAAIFMAVYIIIKFIVGECKFAIMKRNYKSGKWSIEQCKKYMGLEAK